MLARELPIACWAAVLLAAAGCPGETSEVTSDTEVLLTGSSTSTGPRLDSSSSDTPSDTAPSSSSSTADTAAPSCGNGIVEPGEWCDDAGESPTCDENCSDVVCGDGDINTAAGEECDDAELVGASCESLGYDVGELACGGECLYDVSNCHALPDVPVLLLGFSQVKRFDFTWVPVAGADYYQLLERATPIDPFVQIGDDITDSSITLEMSLHFRFQASYALRACNIGGCTDSTPIDVMSTLAEAVGYFKASSSDAADYFGSIIALSSDGNTLAVGALQEDSNATGIGGNASDDSLANSGAVYVFVRDTMGAWSQQAYVKASTPGANDSFGSSVALSADGSTMVVGAFAEDSNATGIGGSQANNSAADSGAAYVFVRSGIGTWAQQAYVKASNTGAGDSFGSSVALSADGNTLAVGAYFEDGNATGIGGNQADNTAAGAGAVYVLVRDGGGAWAQQAYVKASNTDADDRFGWSVRLADDGNTLAVDAPYEDSSATGIDGDEADDTAADSGAVYVFVRDGIGAWSQQAYVKASNPGIGDHFGWSAALSGDGDTLVVGADLESSSATGIDGDQADDTAMSSGAAYVFVRAGMGAWSQEAYVKPSNTGADDRFGNDVALSTDGNVLAIAARDEDGSTLGIGGDETDDAAAGSGAAYVFTREGMGTWVQQTYVKPSNTGTGDQFAIDVTLSGDARVLAVGAFFEDGNAIGLGGDQTDDSAIDAGAVYLY